MAIFGGEGKDVEGHYGGFSKIFVSWNLRIKIGLDFFFWVCFFVLHAQARNFSGFVTFISNL